MKEGKGKCECISCNYSRGEVSLEYALGYCEGLLEATKGFIFLYEQKGIKKDIDGSREEKEHWMLSAEIDELNDLAVFFEKIKSLDLDKDEK